jgi:L-alanine-DL-glutamate epimerase-like enolase superfamily enzyme
VIQIKDVRIERWPVAGAFTISRGSKSHVDVVLCTVTDGKYEGRGEATPIYYHGETTETCAVAIRDFCLQSEGRELSRSSVNAHMPRGAARNALDCALWDIEARRQGVAVWKLAGLPQPKPLATAYTISIDEPAKMERDARAAAGRGFALLKCKLGGDGDLDRIRAVRQGAPDVRLIVDANESWNELDLVAEAQALATLGVELIEQPIRHGEEFRLSGVGTPVPFCADESCQDRADMARLNDFPVINIKLDKAGGLTEAIALRDEAQSAGKRLMLGCMLSTSLGIAPAFLLAQQADWVDLDGALLLASDREAGLVLQDGLLYAGTLWGLPR